MAQNASQADPVPPKPSLAALAGAIGKPRTDIKKVTLSGTARKAGTRLHGEPMPGRPDIVWNANAGAWYKGGASTLPPEKRK